MWTNGFQIAGAGTAFPAAPTVNDLFFRTDFNVLFSYQQSIGWTPVTPGRIGFAAWQSGAAYNMVSGGTQVKFDSIEYDYHGDLGTGSVGGSKGKFIAPIAGAYNFSFGAQITGAAAGVNVNIGLRVGGAVRRTPCTYNPGAAASLTVWGSTNLLLALNDSVELWADTTTIAGRQVAPGQGVTWWAGSLLG